MIDVLTLRIDKYFHLNICIAERDTNLKKLGQRLARKLTKGLNLDPSKGFEWSNTPQKKVFPGHIHIDEPPKAEERIYKPRERLVLWLDGSKLESKAVGTGITWKLGRNWKEKIIPLGRNKEMFNAELYDIQQTINIALKGRNPRREPAILNFGYFTVTVFSDS
jgi:hypothetical protein